MESVTEVGGAAPIDAAVASPGRPLRVLHVASGDLWAGAEAQIYTLLRALASQFPDIRVAAALMNEGELAVRLRQSGLEVHVFDENRLGGMGILMGLRRLIFSWRPDIVHTHKTKENILGALANRTTLAVPSVRTVHGASERPGAGLRGLREALIAHVDLWCARKLQQRLVAVSGELAAQLATRFPPGKVVPIGNGVDGAELRSRVHPVNFRIGAPNDIHVGLAGRLVPVKRVDLFIRMAAALQRQYPQTPWRFHVFGEGPLRQTLERQASQVGRLSITFHGHRADIVACLAGLDVLVMCSDHEGMPMTALESLAVGTKIVAHSVGGLRDALAGIDPAVLVEEHHPLAYAEAVRELLSRRAARTALPERLEVTRTAALTYGLYRELLSGRDSGGVP